jgi:hypothetical protein
MSPARAELARLAEQLETATADRDAAQRQVDRLSLPVTELDKAIANLGQLRAAYNVEISSWYASGCPGGPAARPAEPSDLCALERAVSQLTGDGNASRPALEASQAALDARNAHLSQLALARQSALLRSAGEAALQRLRDRAIPALTAGLVELSAIEGIAAVLDELGRNDPEARSEARAIVEQIAAVRQSIAVKADLDAARAFIAALADNPDLPVPDPVRAEIVPLEPRTIKPMESGERFLNRGEPELSPEPVFETQYGQPQRWAFTPPTAATVPTG